MQDLIAKYPPPSMDAPKYQIVHDLVLRAISDGHWRAGDRLPTELEFAAALPFSLGTVQRAYAKLVEEGVVVRRRGLGSFVTRVSAEMREPWHCRFLDRRGESLLAVYPRIIARKIMTPSEALRRALAIKDRAEKVLRIDRVVNIGQEFDVLLRFYCSARKFPALVERRVAEFETANFKAILLSDYGLPVTEFRQTLSTATLAPEIAARIGRSADCPCTLLEATAFASGGRPVYFVELFVPPTGHRLVVESRYRPTVSNATTAMESECR